MRVDDDLVTYEDPVSGDRTTVNAGETSHTGIELGFGSQFIETLRLDISYSYAKHIYENWVQSGTDFSGNEMVNAPRTIGNARLAYRPGLLNGGRIELELVHLGSYWMDQANTEKYGGYETFNLRMNHQVTAEFNVYARVMNLSDEKYATAATLNRGNPEFAPAMPRTFYAGIDLKF